ncbi:hypothetical protein N2603_38475 [Bradyrhizobium huanghuaihaiense]|uniref:hypothetical protein n=1 Tax=Bradyrhizobium huanghuaihaiense TaxID=990078 RepID=UPI0021AACC73|nr:hypothetical protein [Bradyrhizobium sp. CB3035]UWU75793.1 hypothetical protein N2603_38475 [Bradyrhizobium sp. CB3035]
MRGEDKYGDKLTNLETEFEAELAKASLPAEAKSDILKLARAYKDNFVSFMTQQTLTDQVSDLGQIYDRIRPAIVRIMTAADAYSQAAEMRAEDIRQKLLWGDRASNAARRCARLPVRSEHCQNSRFDGLGDAPARPGAI